MQGSTSTDSLSAVPPPDPHPNTSANNNSNTSASVVPFDTEPLKAYLDRLLQVLLGAKETHTAELFVQKDALDTLDKFAQDEAVKALYINKLLIEPPPADGQSLFLYFRYVVISLTAMIM